MFLYKIGVKTMHEMEDIYDVAYERENLMSVMIELTSRCNWKCEHCYVTDSNNDKYNLDNLKQLFINLRYIGVNEIVLIGGEVFLKKDIMEIISLARSMFFNVIIESNISLLNESTIKKLSELYIGEISCTIFSLDEKIHDTITRKKGSLTTALRNLELLNKYNIKISVKTPTMHKNKYDFRDIYKYCLEKGFEHKVSTSIFPKRNGESLEKLNLSSNDIEDIVYEVDKINGVGFDTRKTGNYTCLGTRISLFLDSQGEAYPCINYRQPLGNIFIDKLDDIWSNIKRTEIANLKFTDLKDCVNCKNFNKCVPCPGISHMESGSILNCTKVSKNIANCRR